MKEGKVRPCHFRSWACKTVGVILGTVCLLVLCTGMTSPYSSCLLRALQGPLAVDDPEFLSYLRDEVLDRPSDEPYNILGKDNIGSKILERSEVFYKEKLGELFKDVRKGFFVEAGALDGETMSNTLTLEQDLDWTGLLVEPDVKNYQLLKAKNRKAWTANVCLAPRPYPSVELFSQPPHHPGPMAVPLGAKMRAMHSLAEYSNHKSMGNVWFLKVPCIPLESLLMAMQVTKIDLLVLDVEGAEMAILEHFDLEKFSVQVLFMEWKDIADIDNVSKKLQGRGYVEVARNFEDIIFVKEDSAYVGILEGRRGGEEGEKEKEGKEA
ncbi:uncharacterized protein LOC122255038 [Penaeus japonicus]|uniref:uncharacterized protein LOC122255038 n=1 Tax=Penaeus japonicus TaxID=27405 RepID=UPI001C710CBB|nr:uncharacterized protein LOC122255038 [Penaeus japonicus]